MPELTGAVSIALGGEELLLLPDRAAYWPARRRLLIADLHLGKGDIFRMAGISVPTGGTRHDLGRLGRLLDATRARHCWILGDLVHGQTCAGDWIGQANDFISHHPQTQFGVVAGNHDRALADSGLRVEALGESVTDGLLRFSHEAETGSRAPGMSGHLHPVIRLPGEPRRIPVFWRHGDHVVLPAFSAFTGGWLLRPSPGDSLHLCNGSELVSLVY